MDIVQKYRFSHLGVARLSIKQGLIAIAIAVVLALVAVLGVSFNAIKQSREASDVADTRLRLATAVEKMNESALVMFAVTSRFAGDTISEADFVKISKISLESTRQTLAQVGQEVSSGSESEAYDQVVIAFESADTRMKQLYQEFDLDVYEVLITDIETLRSRLDELATFLNRSLDDAVAVRNGWLEKLTQHALLSGGGALVIILLFLFVIGRNFVTLIGRLTLAMEKLAGGNVEAEIPCKERLDEIGVMARTVQVFKDNGLEREQLQAEQLAEQQTKQTRAETVNKLLEDFDAGVTEILDTVSTAVGDLESTAGLMAETAQDTNEQASNVATAAEEATRNVQTIASASEELAASLQEVSTQVAYSAGIASKASEEAVKTNQQIEGLALVVENISQVVGLISNIAAQTNLLALNATIEAARAGEAGRGFAVVAGEVKELASQTAAATDEISGQIEAVQGETNEAVKAIQSIAKTIDEMNQVTAAVSSTVEQQTAATREISANVDQAATGTGEVSLSIVKVTDAAQSTNAASTSVLGAAGKLASQSNTIRSKIEEFLNAVRAA